MADIELQRGFQQLGAIEDNRKYGWLGYTIKGVFRVAVLGSPAEYYVHFVDGSFVRAFRGRLNASEDISSATIAVELDKDEKGNYFIKDVSATERSANEQRFNYYSIPYAHTHSINDMEWIGIKVLTLGNVLIANGTQFNSVPQSSLTPPPPLITTRWEPLIAGGEIVIFAGDLWMVEVDI